MGAKTTARDRPSPQYQRHCQWVWPSGWSGHTIGIWMVDDKGQVARCWRLYNSTAIRTYPEAGENVTVLWINLAASMLSVEAFEAFKF